MAYNLATIVQKNPPEADGRVLIIVEFTGNAGEPARRRERFVENETVADLRTWVRNEAAALLGRKSIADALTVGASLDLTPPAPPPGPTAAQIAETAWLEKVSRLVRFRDVGLTNATAVANLASLVADVNATYLAAYAAKV